MASVNEKELTRIIKSGELSGVYYLYGTDLYSVEKYKREMVKRTVKAGDETYNLHEFEGKDIDTDGLSEAVDGFPMFADKLCVTVCDLDLEEETKQRPGHRKLDETRMKQLTETVSNVPDTTVLIFYTANINVCGGKKYPTPKNKKLIDIVAKKGTVCEINVKSRSESVRIICAESSKRGSAMDEKAAGLLFDRCCGNMTMIMNELDKLTSYANGKSIDVHTVELLTPDSGDAKSYSLADAVAAGNMNRSMELFRELINDPENTPVYLLYVLTGSMNDLYRARLALDYNHGLPEIMKDFGYSPSVEFRVKNALSSVRRTDIRHLRKCLEILAKADIDMKSSGADPAVILEKAIVEMLAR